MTNRITEIVQNCIAGIKQRNIRKYFRREALLCMAGAIILAALSALSGKDKSVLKDGSLERAEVGGTERSYEILAEGVNEDTEILNIEVSPRAYTEEEAYEQFGRLMEELPLYILGENESLSEVRTNLNFPEVMEKYPGIRLSWRSGNYRVLSRSGEIHNEELKIPETVSVQTELKTGEFSAEYVMDVTVCPARVLSDPLSRLEENIKKADLDQIEQDVLVLPDEVDGRKVKYSVKTDRSPVRILLFGALTAFLLMLRPVQNRRNERKQREDEMLMDYSDVVSKMLVYIGAGMTVRNAWTAIVSEYVTAVESGTQTVRAVYEEMHRTALELEKGVSEEQAYMDFAHRTGLKCYVRFCSVLEQNRKNGGGMLRSALELEMEEAFEQRKNTAKKLGEEAGTKLVIPLVISLTSVLLIVIIPAIMTIK